MAPKRKSNSEKGSSKTKKTCRRSQRGIGMMDHHDKKKSIVATQKQKRSKSQGKQSKECAANDHDENQLDVIFEEDTSKDPKSLSIDPNNINSTNQETSTSDSCCSNTSNVDVEPKTPSAIQFDIEDDDENDEFKAMFMSNAFAPRTRPNRASTPLIRSQHHSQSFVCGTAESRLSHRMNNTKHGLLSTNTVDHQLTASNIPSRNINTPTNRRVNTYLAPSSQTASGSQPLLSSINYTTNNNAILETFAEYRALKRELQQALNLNETWKSDYQALLHRMQRLEKSSFPRPNADGRAFLEQLLDSMKTSENDEDSRSSKDLADDIGVPETILLSYSSAEPQKTALRIFNGLFPSNHDKESLISVANLNVQHPALLENILVFARRCAPGCGYSMTLLKEAIGNSIRCARHKVKMHHGQIIAAVAVQQAEQNHDNAIME